MRRVIRGVLTGCMALQLTSCGMLRNIDSEEVMGFLEDVTREIGSYQITPDENLVGDRLCNDDAYTGRYLAECDGNTGKDVVFGGASIQERKLYVYGFIDAYSGKASVRIRMNEDVTELEPDEEGYFQTELNLNSGGNYICVKYEDFTGTVEITSGYEPVGE